MAVVCADQHLTYAELNSRSDRLATYLQAHGVCTDDRVAVVKQRSIETIITLLGILKAGAAYVAIEPSTPDERIAFLLDDLEAQFVVVDQSSLNLTIRTGITKIYVDAAWEVLAQQSSCVKENSGSSGQLAYISYTSGSTGIPKGVAVPHSAVVRLVHNPNYASLGPDEVSIQCAPLTFDASTFEIWGCLLNGGRLAVMPPEQISVDALLDAFRCYEVSTAFITTGLFNLLVEHGADDLAKVKQILTGGEAISAVHVKTLLAASAGHSHLSNVYGPTENTTFTTHHPIRTAGSPACPIPIGRPITNTQVYVLDRHMQPVPIGVEGELFAGGPGLARGYWNRPELTAVSFVPNAFSVHPGERLYRTGDLVKWSRDGNLEYLERRDNQVKVRGFRIELGEIENYLGQHRRVAACAVMARSDELGPKRLVAYVVPRDNESLTANELHGYLADHLPAYMVPVAYVFLKELPLTSSGKVDRKMLPRPDYSASVDDYVPPSTAVEIALTGIWSKVLKVEKVGAGDDFFRLGGDSIMAIQVSAAAIRAGLPLSPQQLFETPKLSDAALKVAATLQGEPSQTGQKTVSKEGSGRDQRKNASAFPQAGVSPRELRILFECLKEKYDRDKVEDIYPLSSLQQGMLFHVLQSSHTDLYVNQQAYTLEGPLNVAALKQAFERVVARHPILRTAFVLTAQGKPVQVVLQSVAVPWQVHDWRELTLSVQQERLGDLHRSDREQEFDLEKPPLIRINLVRLREEVYEFIWSLHLMLLDGWSLPLLLDEVLRLYDAITDQREINLPKPLAYAEYIDWLQVQDPGEAERFWRNALHGFDRATALGRDQVVSAPSACEQLYEEKILTLEASETELLRLFAARNQITVNTLAQAAWALILSRRSGTDDVVFGAVVSGRSVDLPCVDVMIGLLLNTIPVRVHLHSHAPLVPWLKELQSQQVEARRYESSSLVDIQGWSEIPRGQALFESVVIFQNSPVDIAWSEVKGKLRMTGMKSVEKNSFPLTFIIIPGPEMLLKIVYDTGQFHSAAATRLLRQAKDFLNAMATAHSKSVLGSLTEEADTDRDQLISSFNRNLEL